MPLLRAHAQQKKAAPRKPTTQQPAPAQKPAAVPARPSPLPPDLDVKRLVLTDGSYQGITKYEIQGERVRYLSSERFEWEEVPYSLVDWAATEKYAREGRRTAARQIDAEEEAERKREEERTPLVAPGLRLPATGGVFLLDVYGREAQLIELQQNGGELNRDRKGNILRSAINPIASQKQTIELPGHRARIQSHVPDPYIYIALESEESQGKTAAPDPEKIKDSYRIVRLVSDAKKNIRIVSNIKIAIYGKVTQQQKFMPTNVEPFSGPWLKVTPNGPLEPGEYALVELLPDNQINLFVWDFGVDPKAPVNPGAWRPEPPKPSAVETSQPPAIRQRGPNE
ncbi:MAG: hypothetical protein ACE14L_11220 [Terriglobales bacterium]